MGFLTLTNISKTFGNSVAVHDFNLDVERGEFVSFLGPSGCGKTTTLRMIAGFESPTTGTIVVNGADITYRPPNQRNVGMVFQSYALFPNMTVAGNIGFGLKIAQDAPGRDRPHRGRDAGRDPPARDGQPLSPISCRAASSSAWPWRARWRSIRRCCCSTSRSRHWTPRSGSSCEQRSAASSRQLGITTIYVTHDQEEALSLSDRIVVMNAGRVEQVGGPFQIYNYPATPFVASFVGTLNIIQAIVRDPAEGIFEVDRQTFRAGRVKDGLVAGQEVKLAIRPEIISMDPEPGANKLSGQVESVVFLGSIVRTRLNLGANNLFFDTFSHPRLVLPQVGETITVGFPAEACLLQA